MHNLALLLLQNQPDPEQVAHVMTAIIPIILAFTLIMLVIVIIPCWFICKKAGLSPWLSLLNLIPAGNLILLYVLAFIDWKVVPIAPPPIQYPYPPAPPQM